MNIFGGTGEGCFIFVNIPGKLFYLGNTWPRHWTFSVPCIFSQPVSKTESFSVTQVTRMQLSISQIMYFIMYKTS